MKGRMRTLLACSAFLLSACSMTPSDCDPDRVPTGFQLAGCVMSGRSRARVTAKEQEISRVVAAAELDRSEAASLERQAAQLAQDNDAQKRLSEMDAELSSLTDQIRVAYMKARDQRAKLQTLAA